MHEETKETCLVGLDIGTDTIKILVGTMLLSKSVIEIIHASETPSAGIERGIVQDISLLKESIRFAIQEAENSVRFKIKKVCLNCSGEGISCQNELGILSLSHGKDISSSEIEQVLSIASSVKLSERERLLHVIPQDFELDQRGRLKNPNGLSGVRLHAYVHLIKCVEDQISPLFKTLTEMGIDVSGLCFSGLASSEAVLEKEEKELGVVVANIGAGTIDLTLYTGGLLRYSGCLPYAGNLVTNDITYLLSTSFLEAERLKIRYGALEEALLNDHDTIEVSGVGGHSFKDIPKKMLLDAIDARYFELFHLISSTVLEVQKDLQQNHLPYHLHAGYVLTGGGAAIRGALSSAEKFFKTSVRLGYPTAVKGVIPGSSAIKFTTALGLIKPWRTFRQIETLKQLSPKKYDSSSFIKKGYQTLSKWLRGS